MLVMLALPGVGGGGLTSWNVPLRLVIHTTLGAQRGAPAMSKIYHQQFGRARSMRKVSRRKAGGGVWLLPLLPRLMMAPRKGKTLLPDSTHQLHPFSVFVV